LQLLSSNEDINKRFCFAGEVGLSGNPSGKPSRPTHQGQKKLGFSTILSKYNKISLKKRVLKSTRCKNRRCGEYVVWVKLLSTDGKQKKYSER
jgi:hypothetical protein